MKRSALILFSALALASPALGQATRPAYQTLVNSDGTETHGRIFGLTDADIAAFDARATRPATLPTTLPTTKPVEPVKPPVVTLPPITRNKANPAATIRGNGFEYKPGLRSTSLSFADTSFEGWAQNIVVAGFKGPSSFTNVTSIFAYRDTPDQQFIGQGMYLHDCGPVTVKGCLFGFNGWTPGKPANNRSGYRHGIYHDLDCGPLVVEDSIFVGNACAGAQSRSGATFRRCVFIDNGIGVLAVKGNIVMDDCLVLSGHRYVLSASGVALSTAGNGGVYSYTNVSLINTWIVGTVGQDAPTTDAGPIKSANLGALGTGSGHRDNPKGKAKYTASGDCRVIGWPTVSPGYGNADDLDGVTFGGSPISYNWTPVVNAALGGVISIPAAREKIAADVRSAVSK